MQDRDRIAGIDVHKTMLAVVVIEGTAGACRCVQKAKFGGMESELRRLSSWLTELRVGQAVMESTAQYWRPVWRQLEGHFELFLAQAQSNRAPRGRKEDFRDAERLARRHLAHELVLSFVPDAQQRLWRTLSRTKYQLRRERVQVQNQLESLLEEAHIKLSSCVSDLLGTSSRRILQALADGEQNIEQLAARADPQLRASAAQLTDALAQAGRLSPVHRQILKLFLERIELIDTQIQILDRSLAEALELHHDAVRRLAEVPGLGPDSAQQIIAEVGPCAATFPSPEELAAWVGTCPGREESAGVSTNNRSPKGNRMMRRLLNQAAHAAVRTRGSFFQKLYRRLVVRLGHNKTIWAVANRLCRLIWKILHQGVSYIEHGDQPDPRRLKLRVQKMIHELTKLGYRIQPNAPEPVTIHQT
jgi:transposase